MSKADDLILANGPYPPVPAVERRLVGLAHHPTIWEVAAPMTATLPDGSRVELPTGSVLREGTGGIDPARLLACARAVIDRDAQCPLSGSVAHDLLTRLREACGDTEADVGARIAAEPRRRSLLGTAPCSGKRPANAGTTGIECNDPACPRHGVIPPPARPTTCRHGTQSHYIKDGTLGCEDCNDAARIAAQEKAAHDAAHLGRPVYDRARGRISFEPAEIVAAPPIPIAEAYRLGMHETPEPIHEPVVDSVLSLDGSIDPPGEPSQTPLIDAWCAAGSPAVMTFTAEEAARLTGIAAIFPDPPAKPRT